MLRRLAQTFANARSSARLDVEIPLVVPGHTNVPWAGCSIDARTGDDCDQAPAELVDFDQVAGRLFVRAPVPGDRFDPLGMGGRTMPLADFFRGRRVRREERRRTPLVCDQRGIIWVGGHRIAERVKTTDQTAHLLALRLSIRDPVQAG